MRIFIAGGSGVIGVRLIPLLTGAGHTVAAMTRTPDKAGLLAGLGAEPVVCDVFDAAALTAAVTGFGPDLLMHQLTDLPDRADQIAEYGRRNSRIRLEGTSNLLAAARAAGAGRFLAQSISWELDNPRAQGAGGTFERMVLQAGGVVIRYGQFYGPGTYYEAEPPPQPRIHVDDAARLTVPALDAPAGLTIVVDDRALHDESE
ncbi:MAG TPA: NAD-dependent epimerase/dehydratase family protein [Streptosporangiaceae bacterium]|nr:NAD-dependent epimerase/dehydratase family protein [Streptosporangiaceae bacterium]